MQRKINFSIDEYYHIYLRGVSKMNIFRENSDRDRFIKLLYLCNSQKPVVFKTIQRLPLDKIDLGSKRQTAIGAYCLMDNHFHLLVREITEGGVSKFMSKLLTAYSKYFNKKYTHVGRVFENTFHAEHADSDEYLKYIYSYIHLNPVKIIDPLWKEKGLDDLKRTQSFLQKYIYSSYLDYVGQAREQKSILNTKAFPEYFETNKDFTKFIQDWLTFQKVTEFP